MNTIFLYETSELAIVIFMEYDIFMDCALLGLRESNSLQEACYLSGCSSWETFHDALEAVVYKTDWITYDNGTYTITKTGEAKCIELLEEEAKTPKGYLTPREAIVAHSDLFGQNGVFASKAVVSEKLWQMIHSETCEPLTSEEALSLQSVIMLQEGLFVGSNPRQLLLNKLSEI
jgi:hypothetical protein